MVCRSITAVWGRLRQRESTAPVPNARTRCRGVRPSSSCASVLPPARVSAMMAATWPSFSTKKQYHQVAGKSLSAGYNNGTPPQGHPPAPFTQHGHLLMTPCTAIPPAQAMLLLSKTYTWAAICSAVLPSLSTTPSRAAPASTRTTAASPRRAARWMGKRELSLDALGSAPACRGRQAAGTAARPGRWIRGSCHSRRWGRRSPAGDSRRSRGSIQG